VGQKSVRHDAQAWLSHCIQLRNLLNLPNYYNLMVKTTNTFNGSVLRLRFLGKKSWLPILGGLGLLCDF